MDKFAKLKELCREINVPEGYLSSEFLFTLIGMDYFFYNGNIGAKDIQDGFVDGKGDGGIDFIYSEDDHKLHLIQGKSSDSLSKEDLHALFNKMHRTVQKFKNDDYQSFNQGLISSYINAIDKLPDNHDIELVLFTNAEVSNDLEKEFRKEIENTELSNYEIIINDVRQFDIKKIESEIEKEYVEEDSLQIDGANNYLSYGENEDGIIVNVLGSSLKRLYNKHNGKGLFNYNLREHISQKNVDDGIDNTIHREKSNFWYYNNGITIACKDYDLDGYRLKLYGFSIINGAQTTTKLGKSSVIDSDHDVILTCKIVRSSAMNDYESTDFMSKISEASNSQKPIKSSDLVANRIEQKKLQVNSANNLDKPLAISIKRGVRPKNYNKVEKWQRVSNEKLGQLMLSISFQQPGTARSAKASIFGHKDTYNKLFLHRTHDFDTLYDMVKLEKKYEDFKIDFIKNSGDEIDDVAIARNGKFIILAVIGYLLKKKRGLVNDPKDKNLHSDNLYGTLISKYREDDFDDILKDLFKFVIKGLKMQYKLNEVSLQLTSYSNFFKTDHKYKKTILVGLEKEFFDDKYNSKRVTEEYYKILDN